MTEHVDVLVIGAGISGIDAGYHLKQRCPDRTFLILDGRAELGGTWDLFRYPGVRSDSDMHTLGFGFKPWTEAKAIADGPSILRYLNETVDEFDLRQHLRMEHLVTRAEWSSETSTWTVHVRHRDEDLVLTSNFLMMCTGYFSYREGYTPEFAGRERFQGRIVHPQAWPDDLDHRDQRVVVIGSGATAITLVPAMAADARHVTMLQRSPTYVVSRPDRDVLANGLRRVLPERWAYEITRRKNTALQQLVYHQTRVRPHKVKEKLLAGVRKGLGPDYDVDTHFTPSYNPWDQRLCLIPNGDLFEAIRTGRASIVTATIDTFTETGIRLTTGEELEADIVVTATGLQLVTLGEVDIVVDGEPVDFSTTWTYRGVAYSDVPNLVSSFGYINASWTLRADLTCAYVCRLLNHMRATGTSRCTPKLRPSDRSMTPRPWIADFSAGYIQRMLPAMPKQGDREPWTNPQRYKLDKKALLESPVDDGVMQFG